MAIKFNVTKSNIKTNPVDFSKYELMCTDYITMFDSIINSSKLTILVNYKVKSCADIIIISDTQYMNLSFLNFYETHNFMTLTKYPYELFKVSKKQTIDSLIKCIENETNIYNANDDEKEINCEILTLI